MKGSKIEKVCFAASSGGHFEQLMMLKPLMERYDSFVVTESTGYETGAGVRTYKLRQVNRNEPSFIVRMIANTATSFRIVLKEKPDAVICTGVLACIPLCLIAKACGAKLVYIESFAKVTDATLTGKLLHRFADRFYVQWESMLDVYPDAVFVGGIY